MNLNELPLEHSLLTDRNIAIKLVGVGGAGANAVDRLKMENLSDQALTAGGTLDDPTGGSRDFYAVDAQGQLAYSGADTMPRTVVEVPYAFVGRAAGKSKMNVREVLGFLKQLWDLRRFNAEHAASRPAHVVAGASDGSARRDPARPTRAASGPLN